MSLLTELFIPPPEEDKVALARWRIVVSSKLWVLIVFSIWSLGLFAYMGFAGFARAGEMAQVKTELQAIQITLLEQNLMLTRRGQCQAIAEGNIPAKQFYAEEIQRLEKRYYQFLGFTWNKPPCDAL